jgi:hypothetical protein
VKGKSPSPWFVPKFGKIAPLVMTVTAVAAAARHAAPIKDALELSGQPDGSKS